MNETPPVTPTPDEPDDSNLGQHTEPIWEEVAEHMATQPYGTQFTHEWLETRLHKKRTDPKYAFDMMAIVGYLKAEGKLLRRRGMNGQGFRILLQSEMPTAAKTAEKQKAQNTKRNMEALIKMDETGVDPKVIQAKNFLVQKMGMIYASTMKLLRMRKLPDVQNPINPRQVT